MARTNTLSNKGKYFEYKERGKCSTCERYPIIKEYSDGSGRIYCDCHRKLFNILKHDYYWGWKGQDKEAVIDKWCRENIEKELTERE